MKRVIFIVWFVFLGFSSFANKDSSWFRGCRLNFEQDALLEFLGLPELNSDRNYTQGLGVGLIVKPNNKMTKCILPKYKDVDPDNQLYLPSEIVIQLAGFTPDELRDSLPIIGDRPYSSLIWLGLKHSLLDAENQSVKSRTFYAGLMGPKNIAKNVQTWVHLIDDPNDLKPAWRPMGWDNQISNGGEFIFMYSQSKTWLLTKKQLNEEINAGQKNEKSKFRYIASCNIGFDVGYLTQFTSGISFKYGKLDLAYWGNDLFNQMQSISALAGNKYKSYYCKPKNNEYYFFANLSPNLTVYNASLHGGIRNSAYRLPYVNTGFINTQLRAGFAASCRRFSVSIYWAFKSPEIISKYSRIHSWGGLSLTYFPKASICP